jgi:hypothetical protein
VAAQGSADLRGGDRLSLPPAVEGLIAVTGFVIIALVFWIVFARWGSREAPSRPFMHRASTDHKQPVIGRTEHTEPDASP